jgi:hypothetical protein
MKTNHDGLRLRSQWILWKFANREARERDDPYQKIIIDGNLALNEGITAVANLIIGAAETAFSNANAYLGVGDSSTAAAAAQTGLQAASNKAYVAMDATYPQISSQTIIWQATFDTATGNFTWNEVTVASGNSDSADNLNRKVIALGTKTAGNEWVLQLRITLS